MREQDPATWDAELQAQRDLAATDGRPYAVPIDCDLKTDAGAPMPTLLQRESEAHLFFYLADEDGIGSLAFDRCRYTSFGPGGEEGHALEGSGWDAYTPMRVMNSRWLARVVGPSTDLSHFLFPFHDTTIECIALSATPRRVPGSMSQAVKATIDGWC